MFDRSSSRATRLSGSLSVLHPRRRSAFYPTQPPVSFVSVALFSRGFVDLFLQLVKEEETRRIVISQRVARSSRILRHKIDEFLRGTVARDRGRFRAGERCRGGRRKGEGWFASRGPDRITEAAGILCVCDVDTRRNCPGHRAARCTRQESTIAEKHGVEIGLRGREREREGERAFARWNWFHASLPSRALSTSTFARFTIRGPTSRLLARKYERRFPPIDCSLFPEYARATNEQPRRVIDIWKSVERLFPRYCV